MGMVSSPGRSLQAKGYALVLVLWLLTLLSMVTGLAYNAARVEIRLTSLANSRLEGEALAEAGIWITLNAMLAAQNNLENYFNSDNQIQYQNNRINVSTLDLAGLVNLNTASAELLALLLSPYTTSQAETEALIQNIRDWVDSDDASANGRSETIAYRNAGLDYSPGNKPFASVDELRLVAGMSDQLYRSIAPYLTIHGTHTQVNSYSAAPALLDLLNDAGNQNTPNRRYLTDTGSNTFIISSEVDINGNRVSNSAIIEITGRRQADAYRILAWQTADIIRKDS